MLSLVTLTTSLTTGGSSPSSRVISRRELGGLQVAVAAAAASPFSAVAVAQAAPAAKPYQQQPGFKLNTGAAFPTASFGLQVYDDSTAQRLTSLALEVGYRNFFASVLAGNQRGFARAIKESGIPREEIFICGSVLSNRAQGTDAARKLSARGCRENMEAFAAGGADGGREELRSRGLREHGGYGG